MKFKKIVSSDFFGSGELCRVAAMHPARTILCFTRSILLPVVQSRAVPAISSAKLCSSSKVPQSPTWQPFDTTNVEVPEISDELARYLERTSLVQFQSDEGIRKLHEAITYVSQIQNINTEGVEPLHSLQENEVMYLREDAIEESCREEMLAQATKTVEDWYFVAPPGNIPLNQLSIDNTRKED